MAACLLAAIFSVFAFSDVKEDSLQEVLGAIAEATDGRIAQWEMFVVPGPDIRREDMGPWTSVRLPRNSRERRVRYRTVVRIPEAFAGTRIQGGKAELQLAMRGPADYWAEVYINGEQAARYPIVDPETRAHDCPPLLLSESAGPGEEFEVEVAFFNPLVYPPHEFLDATKEVRFWGATLTLETAEPMRRRLEQFAINIRAAEQLTRPWQRNPGDRRPYWPEPVNNSRLDTAEQERLRSLLSDTVLDFNLQALAAGDAESLGDSMEDILARLEPLGRFAKRFTVHLVGNAHIDLAWLWRTNETVQISANTFRSVLGNMEQIPQMTYAQSQAQAYRWVQEAEPELFERIQEAARQGTWDVVGGMWAEPDCNLIGGESWIRQLLYAQNYFAEHFGQPAALGWNPDSFGYNWNMPQYYSKAGIKAFITQKIHWNDTTVFPHHLFWWEAPDGSRILTYFPTGSYTEQVDPDRMVEQLMHFEQCSGFGRVLVLIGYGDHGGGPNLDMAQRALMLDSQPLYPNVRFTRAHDFIDGLLAEDLSHIPVWRSELYAQFHRGTLTTQSETKRNNRSLESLLETAEKAAALAWLGGAEYPAETFERAWKLVLLNQFHDILPGSSITPVYSDADEDYALARKLTTRALDAAMAKLAERAELSGEGWRQVLVFNQLSWERDAHVSITLPLDAPEDLCVMDSEGGIVLSQISTSDDGLDRQLHFIAGDLPPLACRVFTLHEGATPWSQRICSDSMVLSNEYLQVRVDRATGNIVSILDRASGREALARGEQGNRLQIHENLPSYWDAWNIGYTDRSWELNEADSVELVENGPARAVIRVRKSFLGPSKANRAPTEGFPSSFFTQDIILWAASRQVDVTLRTDWWEDHMLLKVAFPLAVSSDVATYEIPHGHIERSTRRERPEEKAQFEVAMHRWADLSDFNSHGVSLLNDSKYGVDTLGSVMRMTIHTSPLWPDPVADRGRHQCSYAIYPHAGSWQEAGTSRLAQELNLPPVAVLVSGRNEPDAGCGAPITISSENADLTTLKLAEDGSGLIIRLVDSSGEGASVELALARDVQMAFETDLLERELAALQVNGSRLRVHLRPNEVKSIKLVFAD